MKKLFTLLTLALFVCSGVWAETEVSPVGGSSNAAVNGKSFSINGTTNAGSGTQISPMSDKGIKVRKSTPLVMTVNDGYRINSVTAYAASNDNSKTFQISKIEVDGVEYVPAGEKMPITCVQKNASSATTINITGIAAKDNITFTFDGTNSQGIMEFHVDYTQEEVIVQEISSVTLNGVAISDDDLSTLKSTKALEIVGSSLNGIGALDVTLSSGATTVTRTIDGTTATYTFTINSTDTYTVTVTGIGGTYTEQGAVVYYKKGETDVDGANTKSVTANGITFTMVNDSKTFQYGTGSVTLGETKYVPLKLSTGSAVNVTFPEGKVATKVIVYGWSQNGNGKFNSMSESNGSAKSVDVSSDVFYATNTAGDIYPSVYEYELDNWESLFFNPGGSPSQPFVVMDFVLEDAPTTVPVTITSAGYATFSNASEVTVPEGVTAYTAVVKDESTISLLPIDGGVIPAGEGVVLEAAEGNYNLNITTTGAAKIGGNLLKAQLTEGTPEDAIYYTLAAGPTFKKSSGGTLAAGKAYLVLTAAESRGSFNVTFGDATGISEVNAAQEDGALYNLNGIRVAKATKGLYVQNGKKVIVK
jgi:hypothetical protein